MKTHSSILYFFGLILGLILILEACAPQTTPDLLPGWSPLPTRAPIPVLTIEETLGRTRAALLRGDLETAERNWEQAQILAPDNAIVRREGARVALAAKRLDVAEERIWQALRLQPDEPSTWVLLGLILDRQGDSAAAHQALTIARNLNPELAPELFTARWTSARRAGNGAALEQLAQEYAIANPEDPLSVYYRSEALISSGDVRSALDLLLLEAGSDSPAVVWYTLARTYIQLYDWKNGLTALEVANNLFARGDNTFFLASDVPARDINLTRARAYLGLRRCVEAEPLLRKLSTPQPELLPLWRQAQSCMTPSPTWTAWLPSNRGASPPGAYEPIP